VGYVVGFEFWHAHVGPLPLTLDRILLMGLVAAFVGHWRWQKLDAKPVAGVDWLVLALLAVFSVSTILNRGGNGDPQMVSPMWRLVASYWIPAVVYWIARQSRIDFTSWKTVLAALTCLGIYLAGTALAETSGQWWAVFPRYISDPELGLHFGRARGPHLNSASLGMFLTACLWCAWTLRSSVDRRWQVVLLATLPLMASAVYLTYTRSTWLGLAGSTFVVLWLSLPRHLRMPVVGGAGLVGLVMAAVLWGSIIGLRREGSAAESEHSVSQRTAFAYVSWQMFKDHPITGVGFGRFYDRKLPYLADRSQDFELESLRELDHHNTLLSVLTETGMVGLAAFIAVAIAWARYAWSLAKSMNAPGWVRAHGVLMVALLATFLPTALFHDITHLPMDMTLVFAMAGITVGLARTEWAGVSVATIRKSNASADLPDLGLKLSRQHSQ
jgi:O-antigen ligase